MAHPNSFQWVGSAPANVVWQRLGSDYVAYHRPSGKTHFLNAASQFLVAELLEGPLDTDSIVQAFQQDGASAADSDPAARSAIVELLDRLERLGLISRV